MVMSLKRYLRRLWGSHGGGFYGLVAALTFLYLEAVDLAGDFAGIGGFAIADLSWWIGMAVDNIVDAVLNGVWAALWSVTWIERFGISLRSAALLGIVYLGYVAVRPWILRLLHDPHDTEALASQPVHPL